MHFTLVNTIKIAFGLITFCLVCWLFYKLVRWAKQYLRLPQSVPDSIFPDSKFTDIDGFRIRYIQRGDKKSPNLVLIHGIGASIFSWRHMIEELSHDFRITAFDLPGFGHSDKHANKEYGLDEQTLRIFQFLDKLKIEKFFLAGHSMGGGIAAWMAKTSPARVLKVGLLAPAVDHRLVRLNPRLWWWGVRLVRNFIVTPALVRQIYLRICILRPAENIESVIEHYYRPYHQKPEAAETFFKHLHLIRDHRLTQEVTAIECEALIIYGEKDPIVRMKSLTLFLEKNPRSRLVTIANAGHLIAEETPQIVTKKLQFFFTTRT